MYIETGDKNGKKQKLEKFLTAGSESECAGMEKVNVEEPIVESEE